MNRWSYNAGWILVLLVLLTLIFSWVNWPSKDMALLKASSRGDTNQISALVQEGASVNGVSRPQGKTPLMAAAASGNRPAVELLLRLGADKDGKDRTGKKALDYAIENGRTNLLDLLELRSAH